VFNETQDWLIFLGIPLTVIAIVFVLVYAAGARSAKRYRPGRAYDYAPVWFLAKPAADGPQPGREIEAASGTAHPGLTGGASDRW
jgi:hypothetical protein